MLVIQWLLLQLWTWSLLDAMQQPPSTDNTKKVIVIGDGYCGKTTLVAKITEGKFINNYHVTLGGKKRSEQVG